jgi:hypothetical protein
MIDRDGDEAGARGMAQQVFAQQQKQRGGIAAAGNGGDCDGTRRQVEMLE